MDDTRRCTVTTTDLEVEVFLLAVTLSIGTNTLALGNR